MKLLVDANLSPRVARLLQASGHQAEHVDDLGLNTATDEVILAHAAQARSVLVSADTDFGMLLAAGPQSSPSLVLLRSADHLTPDQQASLVAANLPSVEEELLTGAIVTIAQGRLRLRTLPIKTDDG